MRKCGAKQTNVLPRSHNDKQCQRLASVPARETSGDNDDDGDVVWSPKTARTRITIQKESYSSHCSSVLHQHSQSGWVV